MHKVSSSNKEDTTMTKNMYIQPSVKATEIMMVQTLCVSGGGGGNTFSTIDPEATTGEQL
jgi:hypothetical protein